MAELFKQAVKVIFLAVCLHVSMVQASLSCLSCSNVQKISDCETTVQCPEYNNCFTQTFGVIGYLTFNLGCKPHQDCLTLHTDSTLIGKRQSAIGEGHCHQCCGLNNCNRDTCANFTTYLSSTDSCLDSPDINCHTLSQVTNICADVEHAKLICKQFCGLCLLVDGGWSNWSTWSSCDVTCDNGQRTRTRTCSNPSPKDGGHICVGSAVDSMSCHFSRHCPDMVEVDGSWSVWQPWGNCSTTCGVGLKTRMRTCSSPSPSHQGRQCLGDVHQSDLCKELTCAAHVRLASGAKTDEGRVEVFYNGEWGTVCDAGWTQRDAQIVCRMLGKPYTNPVAHQGYHFGPGSGPILMDSVACTGTESHLFDCPFRGWGRNSSCTHSEDAGVSCH